MMRHVQVIVLVVLRTKVFWWNESYKLKRFIIMQCEAGSECSRE